MSSWWLRHIQLNRYGGGAGGFKWTFLLLKNLILCFWKPLHFLINKINILDIKMWIFARMSKVPNRPTSPNFRKLCSNNISAAKNGILIGGVLLLFLCMKVRIISWIVLFINWSLQLLLAYFFGVHQVACFKRGFDVLSVAFCH